MLVIGLSGSLHRQERTELPVGETGLRDPDAELGGSHGGPDPPQGDHRQQRERPAVTVSA